MTAQLQADLKTSTKKYFNFYKKNCNLQMLFYNYDEDVPFDLGEYINPIVF